ncbi:hypothetical protein [Glycomyces harbinensis]|uniref:Uncharacterized protein n=1 Tax=Glycomyces harbinensis TaxID=58114 RepID=A0A1G6SHA5_9ACTN|nr:hypothetical protein [Glycomyces harbinensis]SDD16021.1 hypothetical protein SAMN05216270_10290 [Glycomyces harbinensis]
MSAPLPRFPFRRFVKRFVSWSVLNTGIITLPLISLLAFATGGPDMPEVVLMLVLSGFGSVLGIVLVVLPSAFCAESRLRRGFGERMHSVPYIALILYALAAMAVTGIFFMVLLVLQSVGVVVLHVLMMRHYRKTATVSGAVVN